MMQNTQSILNCSRFLMGRVFFPPSQQLYHTSPVMAARLVKNRRTAVVKKSRKGNFPVTYDQLMEPEYIGVKKGWLSWNTSNLFGVQEEGKASQLSLEDQFIRRLMFGVFRDDILGDVIIKRRHNITVIAGIVSGSFRVNSNRLHFNIGLVEELLEHVLKGPVKLELSGSFRNQQFEAKRI